MKIMSGLGCPTRFVGLSDVSGVADVNLLRCANVLLLRANSNRRSQGSGHVCQGQRRARRKAGRAVLPTYKIVFAKNDPARASVGVLSCYLVGGGTIDAQRPIEADAKP